MMGPLMYSNSLHKSPQSQTPCSKAYVIQRCNMRSQCHQHLMCYEHTQQNVPVGVDGEYERTRTQTGMHTQTHTHQHASFCVVILLCNATNYNTSPKKYNTLDISKILLITPGSPVKI
jgi:hypothetical protein